MGNSPKYKRILLKLSGEALANGKSGLYDYDFIDTVVSEVKQCLDVGVQIAIVVGGGNIWRGRQGGGMDRVRADRMGMLATVMNSIALQDAFVSAGVDARVLTAVEIKGVAEPMVREEAIRHLESGRVVIFGAGTGSPYFTTDTTAILRAAEIKADIAFFAKNIDGVYTADPKVDPNAKKLDEISYSGILSQRLGVMDLTAASFGMENKLPVLLFGLADPENIVRGVNGEKIGTVVTC
ncbi:MAG: UMP kinase [Clostridia bacterium]|nr:UMP kinase [Clostridia bacterium]